MILNTLLSGSKASFISDRLIDTDEAINTKAYSLYLTGQCNLHCPYCIKADDRQNMPEFSIGLAEKFVKLVVNTRCTLSVLGGEPTLCKNLNDILKILSKTNHDEIIVLSNGTIPITPVPGIIYQLTLHDISARQRKTFIDNCRKIAAQDTRNLLVELRSFDEEIIQEFGACVRQLWIDGKPSVEFAENIHSSTYYYNGIKINAKDVLNMQLNRFKGWSCLIHDFAVYGNGAVKFSCLDTTFSFENFEPYRDYIVQCPYRKCQPECLLESIKFLPK